MAKQITVINFILDRSISMETVASTVVSSFNEFLLDQQKDQQAHPELGEILMTLTTFNTNIEIPYTFRPIQAVEQLTPATYEPRGNTALWDAVGRTITAVEDALKARGWMERRNSNGQPGMPSTDPNDFMTALAETEAAEEADPNAPVQEEKPQVKVLLVIQTDGEENSSREYKKHQIQEMIREREERGNWTFAFLGANMDAAQEGGKLGVAQTNAMGISHDKDGYLRGMRATAASVSRLRRSAVMQSRSFYSDPSEPSGHEDAGCSWTDKSVSAELIDKLSKATKQPSDSFSGVPDTSDLSKSAK